MKLPTLFKSLFDFEAENPSPEAMPEPPPGPNPQPHPDVQSEVQSVQVDESTHEPDPLLDAIDALGNIVLALDAQLREERCNSAQLRSCLNDELTALRTVLLH